MPDKPSAPWGLKAIIVFYGLGVAAATITLVTNRAATGQQLAAVHGLSGLAGLPAILLTIALGVAVVLGLNSMRPWGWWLTMAYMTFLLVVPPLTLGSSHVSIFANILWPLLMVIYLVLKRRLFGIDRSAERLTSASS